MRLINQTKDVVLAQNVLVAKNLISRAKGLLGKNVFPFGQALILDPCNSVHTFFMTFPIDLLFVDKNNKIIKILQNLGPNRVTWICWNAHKVVELPYGSIKITGTQLQDQLQLLD